MSSKNDPKITITVTQKSAEIFKHRTPGKKSDAYIRKVYYIYAKTKIKAYEVA